MNYTLYAHRGNLFGPKPELENTPDYIDQAIKFGFKVEVDVWLKEDGNLYLGHDKPDTLVSFEYLLIRHDNLLIHAKNIEALLYLSSRTTLSSSFTIDSISAFDISFFLSARSLKRTNALLISSSAKL